MTEPKVTRAEHKELSEKKRAQARLSTAAGTLGLGAFGALAGSKALPKVGQGLARTGRNVNQARLERTSQKLGRGALETGTVSGGVGAASSLNFAALSRKESQKEEALAMGKNPNNPKIKKSVKRKYMNNTHALSKSLSDLAKASQAVSQDSPAWKKAKRDRGNNEWRYNTSESSQRAHDEALLPSRRKRDLHRAAGNASFVGSGATALAATAAKRKRTAVPLAATAGLLTGAGVGLRDKANQYDLPSRKIRARGFQRQMDEQVGKAFRMRVPGGFSRSSVVNTPGKKAYSRRGYLTRTGR